MYEPFFKLSDTPFKNTPDPRYFFPTEDREEALASMWYTVMRRRGVMMLTGDAGVGKSMLVRMLINRLRGKAVFAEIGTPRSADTDHLHSICADLGVEISPNASHAQIQRNVVDYLSEQATAGKPVVIIADAAEHLSDQALRFVAQLADLDASTAKLVQIILVGGELLRQRLHQSQFAALRQRLSRVCRLTPLNQQQTYEYIRHRIEICGGKSELVSNQSAGIVHECAGGIARLINTICDNALLAAMADNSSVVKTQHVKSAAEMIDCGPMETHGEDNSLNQTVASHPGNPPVNINVTPDFSALGQQISTLKEITNDLRHSHTPAAAQPINSQRSTSKGQPTESRAVFKHLSKLEKQLKQAVENAPAESSKICSRLDSIEKRMHEFSQDIHTQTHEPPTPQKNDEPIALPETRLDAEVTVVEYECPASPIADDEQVPEKQPGVAERIRQRRQLRQQRSHQNSGEKTIASQLLENVHELDSMIDDLCRGKTR